jgi:hypothetical protein
MAFDNVVAAGSAETLLVFFFSFIVLFHDSHQKSLLSLYLLPNLSSPPPITTRIVKSFFLRLGEKTHTKYATCRERKKEKRPLLLGTQDRQLSPIRSFESLKNLPHIFPFKKPKKFLNCHFHSFRLSNRKRKRKSFSPIYFSLITSDWYHPPLFLN